MSLLMRDTRRFECHVNQYTFIDIHYWTRVAVIKVFYFQCRLTQ